MTEPGNSNDGGEEQQLFTLSDISQKTSISMPTLQRYKKLYQGRIPSVGNGRKQRYPASSLPVFEELRLENMGRRGRPRKDASAAPAGRRVAAKAPRGRKAAAAEPKAARRGRPPGRPPGRPAAKAAAAAEPARRGRPPGRPPGRPAARLGRPPGRPPGRPARAASAASSAKKATSNLLTLTQISKTTGISYPTLVRYVRMHSDRLPHEGKGRARRFYPDAVEVFRALRQESGRGGRKPKVRMGALSRGRAAATAVTEAPSEAGLAKRVKAIEKSQADIEKRFRGLVQNLQKLLS